MAEVNHRQGALPRLDGLCLCEVGSALKSHLCLSPGRRGLAMQEMLKGCSTFSWEKEVRNLLPIPLLPDPHQRRERAFHDLRARALAPSRIGCLEVSLAV